MSRAMVAARASSLAVLATLYLTLVDAFLAPSPVLHLNLRRIAPLSISTDHRVTSFTKPQPRSHIMKLRNAHTLGTEKETAGKEVAPPKDVSPSKAVSQSIWVDASVEQCLLVASDLDTYMEWCRTGGMKSVDVLKRYDDGRAENVRFRAGAMGIDMINIMEYNYDNDNNMLSFRALEGDVMKTLDGCYRFEEQDDGTLVTYELLLGFGSKLPDFAIKAISGAIIRTALGALKKYVEQGDQR